VERPEDGFRDHYDLRRGGGFVWGDVGGRVCRGVLGVWRVAEAEPQLLASDVCADRLL